MSYDPCTCFIQSDLQVSFAGITSSSLVATGRSLGVSISIADISSGAIGANGVKGNNPFSDNYISSFLPAGTTGVSTLVQDFQTAQSIATQLSASSFDWSGLLNKLFKFGGDVSQAIGASMDEDNKGKIANTIGLGLSAGSDYFDFFSMSSGQSNSMPMVISSQLVLSGTISTSHSEYGSGFYISNPGTPSAASSPEYGNMVSGVSPSYPMYNQTMGLFALLSAPGVYEFRDHTELPCSSCDHHKHRIAFSWQFAGDLQYALNPIVDAAATKIWAGLEIEAFPASAAIGGLTTDLTFGSDIPTNITQDGISLSGHKIYRTDYLPIECLSGIIAKDKLPDSENINDESDEEGRLNDSLAASGNVTIKLIIAYVFKPDEYGVVHSSTQILKFPVSIIPQSSDLNIFSGYQLYTPFPTNLTIPTTAYTDAKEIFSYGTITITGDITNTSGTVKYITAEKEIDVVPGASIGPDIILQIAPGPSAYCNQSQIAPTTVDNTYCTGSTYQANQAASKTDYTASQTVTKPDPFDLSVYPNPTSDICHVVFTMPAAGAVTMDMTDMTGREVRRIGSGSYPAGQSQVAFSTSDIAAGIYTLRYTDTNGNTASQRLVVSHADGR